MKQKYLYAAGAAILAIVAFFIIQTKTGNKTEVTSLTSIEEKRAQHKEFLENSPYKERRFLSREKRKELAIPPNGYYEREWELTMNPTLGIPTPYELEPVVNNIAFTPGAPGTVASPWVERGPLDVGGRTRVAFYDPNDVGANNGDGVNYNRVFAGGVGGGLWVNNDVTDANSSWTIIPGVAGNLQVSAFAIDPNDSNTFYLGTGESYTSGATVGNGVYKSTDGGATWANVNITAAGPGNLGSASGPILFESGIFYVNDIAVRDVNGSSELYVGVGSVIYASPNFTTGNPVNVLGEQNAGLYRSTDDGATWNRVQTQSMALNSQLGTVYVIPNDFEIAADNTLYMGTINNSFSNSGGGRIYSSTDGLAWTLEQTIPQTSRVEIAVSSTNADRAYVASNTSGQADLRVTTDGFTTLTRTGAEPNDADNGIPFNDYARNQAFYDLMIEVDPTNDQIVYVGGINMHRTTTGGLFWTQASKWANNPNMNVLNVPFIHADVHSMSFHPTNNNQALIGSDGGVSWANNLSQTATNPNSVLNRNRGYNVTQFYYGGYATTDAADGDDFSGGTQDNGSPTSNDAPANGLATFFDPIGGDGGYNEIDKDGQYVIASVTGRTHIYLDFPIAANTNINALIGSGRAYVISQGGGGDFINVAELDDNLNILFSNTRTFSNANGIEACTLGANSAACRTLSDPIINNSRPTAMKVSPNTVASTTLLVGTDDSKLARLTNANSSFPIWTEITGPNFLGSVSDIEFGATDQEIFVTMHNYGVENIWYSDDAGVTWDAKEGNLPDMPVKAILKNPLLPEEVIIGTEQGIWVTGDFNSPNPTWTQAINGMTSTKIVDLDLRTTDNTVMASTHGRGIFTSTFTTAGFYDVTASEQFITVYPTVSDGNFNIVSKSRDLDASISIYNLSGQQVYSDDTQLTSDATAIALNVKSGYYLVKITSNGIEETAKILIE